MKLIKLIISNFRGLKGSNTIDFTNSNIIFLIGQNNIGKSSFLRAYEFFIDPKQIAKTDDFNNYDYSTTIIIEGIFELDEEDSDDPDLKEKKAVSYTHLDVYKRQLRSRVSNERKITQETSFSLVGTGGPAPCRWAFPDQ